MDEIEKKKIKDKLIIGAVCILFIVIVIALIMVDEKISHKNDTIDKERITVSEFSFQRDGLPFK